MELPKTIGKNKRVWFELGLRTLIVEDKKSGKRDKYTLPNWVVKEFRNEIISYEKRARIQAKEEIRNAIYTY